MKKACMKCKSVDSDYTWEEKYEVSEKTNSEEYLKDMIERFNQTLRPRESARKILEIWEESTDGTDIKTEHIWEKTNLVTIMKGGSTYDTCKCTKCGITGKRFGLGGQVQRDAKFKGLKYNFCQANNNE